MEKSSQLLLRGGIITHTRMVGIGTLVGIGAGTCAGALAGAGGCAGGRVRVRTHSRFYA